MGGCKAAKRAGRRCSSAVGDRVQSHAHARSAAGAATPAAVRRPSAELRFGWWRKEKRKTIEGSMAST